MEYESGSSTVSFAEDTVRNLAELRAFLDETLSTPGKKGLRTRFQDVRTETARLLAELPRYAPRFAAVYGPGDPPCRIGNRFGVCWHEVALHLAHDIQRASARTELLSVGDEIRVRLAREALTAAGRVSQLKADSPLICPISRARRQSEIDSWILEAQARQRPKATPTAEAA